MVFLFLVLLMVSCAGAEEPSPSPTPLTGEPAATSTPQEDLPMVETEVPTETAIADPEQSTSTAEPTVTPDFSRVDLFEATHLMDPNYFQVSLENWPEDLPEGTQVLVGGEIFNCDELFPDQYPDRVYCWGPAPDRGREVKIIVHIPGVDAALLEILFKVPSPGGG